MNAKASDGLKTKGVARAMQYVDDDYVCSYRMMQRWTAETLPLAGEYFRQVVKDLL